jgi:hypothetical protein
LSEQRNDHFGLLCHSEIIRSKGFNSRVTAVMRASLEQPAL